MRLSLSKIRSLGYDLFGNWGKFIVVEEFIYGRNFYAIYTMEKLINFLKKILIPFAVFD